MRNKFLTLSFLGALVTSAVSSVIALPRTVLAATPTCYLYKITIQGTVSDNFGSKSVALQELALWRTAGIKANPSDLWIISPQEPNSSSSVVGQIDLMTNSLLAHNPGIASARLDLAEVSTGSKADQFTLDSDASLQLTNPNVFTGPGVNAGLGGLGGLSLPYLQAIGTGDITQQLAGSSVLNVAYFVPHSGGGSFAFRPNQIVGNFSIIGSQVDNFGTAAQYQAKFSGPLVNYWSCPV